jgi:hypothetical protein
MLMGPSVAGAVLFLQQLIRPSSVLVPLFNVGMAAWGTLLLEGWKRHNARLAFEWGVTDATGPDVERKVEEKVLCLRWAGGGIFW